MNDEQVIYLMMAVCGTSALVAGLVFYVIGRQDGRREGKPYLPDPYQHLQEDFLFVRAADEKLKRIDFKIGYLTAVRRYTRQKPGYWEDTEGVQS